MHAVQTNALVVITSSLCLSYRLITPKTPATGLPLPVVRITQNKKIKGKSTDSRSLNLGISSVPPFLKASLQGIK